MKILHIISGLGIGGAENTLCNLVKYDNQNEHIVLSLSRPMHYEKILKKNKVEVLNFDLKNLLLKDFFKLIFYLKKNKPKIIQCWMYHAEFLSIFIKLFIPCKILWNIRNSTPYSKSFKTITRLLIYINSFFSKIVPAKIISCSIIATKNHIDIGYDKKKIHYIPNGVDFNKFKFTRKLVSTKKNFKIGCVARWNPQKDHLNLLAALNHLLKKKSNWICFLVGKNLDNKNKYLKKIIKDYELNNYVKLLGPKNNIQSFYKKINFLVLPSKDGEGFPNVILEAYASGIPSISTDIGDTKFVLNNKKYLVKPRNHIILSNAIFKMLNDKNIFTKNNRTKLRKNAQKKYSIHSMIRSYNFVWKKIN
tara:strand:- start:2127 stop:3215 length:1089 start_codon:yes stop_codon:yes gene_type:complete